MILHTFLALVGFGLVLFAMGLYFDRPDAAFVGALFVVGVGAATMDSGLMVQTGTDVTVNNVSQNVTYENATAVYEEANSVSGFPVGSMVIVAGVLLMLLATGRMSET